LTLIKIDKGVTMIDLGLKEKIAIITGANTGIGREIAL